MCGISGYLSTDSLNRNYLFDMGSKMNQELLHRGPDDNATWINDNSNLMLNHTRLSIIDLSSNGSQPMHSSCNRYVMKFNGEIYNHLEIKKNIENSKYSKIFRGHSDTEILIEAISLFGLEETLKKAKGMFALAIWDKKKNILKLARDRFGEKPLYYFSSNKYFIFASELKAFNKLSFFNKSIDQNSVKEFLNYSFIPAPKTIYKNVFKLMPSTIIEVDKNINLIEKKYWKLEKKTSDFNSSLNFETNIVKNIKIKLNQITKQQMISDAPIGSFLSGGTDSTLISFLMQENLSQKLNTFSICYEDNRYDESFYSRKISQILGSNHSELILSEKDIQKVIPSLSTIYDEPFADSSQLPSILVSKHASQNVKVCLSGDGGDEVFAGYNRHLWINSYWPLISKFPMRMRSFISKVLVAISEHKWDSIYNILSFYKKEKSIRLFGEKIHKIADVINKDNLFQIHNTLLRTSKNNFIKNDLSFSEQKFSHIIDKLEPLDSILMMDINNYLPNDILTKVDRASMTNSLETRLPFLDHELVENVFNLPSKIKIKKGKTKWILKKILEDYLPNNLIYRSKMGFGVPIDKWLRGPLKEWGSDLISESKTNKLDMIDYKKVNKVLNEHINKKNNFHHEIWNILILQSWIDKETL